MAKPKNTCKECGGKTFNNDYCCLCARKIKRKPTKEDSFFECIRCHKILPMVHYKTLHQGSWVLRHSCKECRDKRKLGIRSKIIKSLEFPLDLKSDYCPLDGYLHLY